MNAKQAKEYAKKIIYESPCDGVIDYIKSCIQHNPTKTTCYYGKQLSPSQIEFLKKEGYNVTSESEKNETFYKIEW